MRTSITLLGAAFLATATSAFRDSSPLLIWSSKDKEALRDAQETLTSGVINAEEIYRTLPSLGCGWKRVVVVHMDELHQSHVPSLKIVSTQADLHIPYLINPTASMLDSALGEWAQICGADVLTGSTNEGEGKRIVKIAGNKQDDLLDYTSADYVILTGTRSSSKRQQPDVPERPFPSVTSSSSSSSTRTSTHTSSPTHHNSTVPSDAPLLDRVQLLSTPIITALLISFAIFVPVVMCGVSALAGIQVPPRMLEIGKGMTVGKEKKDQ